MPTAKLKAVKKFDQAAVRRQAPEPRNRILRRELLHERRVTKQTLRELIACGEAGRTEYPHRCE
jgi:hypothetical protein